MMLPVLQSEIENAYKHFQSEDIRNLLFRWVGLSAIRAVESYGNARGQNATVAPGRARGNTIPPSPVDNLLEEAAR